MNDFHKEQADHVIGFLTWWDIPKKEHDQSVVQQFYKEANLPEPMMPKVVAPSRVFVRALRAIEKQEKEHMLRKIPQEDSNTLVYCLLREIIDREGQKIYVETDNTVTFDKDNGTISFLGEFKNLEITELNEVLQSKINELDLRRLVAKLISYYRGTLARLHGGVYFNPSMYLTQIENVRAFLQKLGGDLHIADVVDTPNTTELLISSFLAKTQEEVEELAKAFDQMKTESARPSTYEARIAEVTTLLLRVNAYTEYLQAGNRFDALKGRAQWLKDEMHKTMLESGGALQLKFGKRMRMLDVSAAA